MDILRHFNFEGAEESASATSSIPDTVSLNSDESPSDSELSDYEDYPRKPSSAARQLRGKQTQPSLQNSHSYFELSSAVLNTFDSFQSQCCGYDDVASMLVDFAIRPRERWSAFESKHSPDRVSVVVEAAAITYLDADIQQAASCWENTLPFIVGNHFVGVVRHCGSEAEELGIRKGTRVASIVNWRCGSKSLTVPAANLAIVPSQLDAGDVATLVAYYLPAFQALHHGQPRRNRYSRNRLSGKKVLVAGGGALHAHAFMKLALWAGAEVYATKSSHHFDILGRMRSVIVLDDDGSRSPWPSENGGFMDIAVDFDYPRNFDFTRFSLAPTGRLICIRNKISSRIASDWMLGLEEFCDNYRLTLVPRASLYDFEENFEHHPDRTRSDLNFLMKLLATRQIRPQIDRYIKLEDVPRVHGEMQTLPPGGAIICDFWKE